jgi:flavin reductase (DIM6/NTAB) family NADH-FMN oxidoreductase RutF
MLPEFSRHQILTDPPQAGVEDHLEASPAECAALAERFAGPREQRWVGLSHGWSAAGVPLLEGCLARFECRHRSAHEEGDHVILVAQVERCHSADGLQPLLYHRGRLLASAEL